MSTKKSKPPKRLSESSKPAGAPDSSVAWGSDVAAQMLRRLDIPYIALNPGASYRGLHDSLVNHLGNRAPEMLMQIRHQELSESSKPAGAPDSSVAWGAMSPPRCCAAWTFPISRSIRGPVTGACTTAVNHLGNRAPEMLMCLHEETPFPSPTVTPRLRESPWPSPCTATSA